MVDTGRRELRPPGRTGSGRRPRALLPGPRRTPLTFWYLAVLLGTTLYARLGAPGTVRAAVAASSTDAWHLEHTPLRVLVLSALWTAGPYWAPYLVAFSATLAPLERRIGSLRTLQVFALGHVLATLASEVPIALRVRSGGLPEEALHRVDIGVSYGLLACVGALAALLPTRLRYALPAAAAALALHPAATGTDPVTAVGHPAALLIGLACWGPVRRWARARQTPAGVRCE